MSKFVSQDVFPSGTTRARNRVRYLSGLRPDVEEAVRAYFAANPNGEEVTVAVATAVGQQRFQAAAPGKSVDDLKRDLGLFVAITVADMYPPARVLTYRGEDGVTASTRPVRRSAATWIANYTPHRLLPERAPSHRILLDTSVVRKVIHGDANALDLDALARLKGERLVSISDIALVELAHALLVPGLPMDAWATRVAMFDRVLDPAWPVAPGGWELAVMSGLLTMPGMNVDEARAYYAASWRYLADSKSASDLSRKVRFEGGNGKPQQIGPLDLARVEAVLSARAARWKAACERAAANRVTDGEELAERIRENVARSREDVGLLLAPDQVDKLDLLVRVYALRAVQAGDPKQPYNADANDAMDLELLVGVQMPALICTADERLVNLARASGAFDGRNVMTPKELLDLLSLST